MPRFAVLEHDHPFLHWDLLLERGEVARTWRLLAEPTGDQLMHGIAAESLDDHRPMYLDYEGPVSGDRGHVSCWDAGTYDVVAEEEPDELVVELAGERLRGRFAVRVDHDGDRSTFQSLGTSES